jgi:prepilin-type N-terminal cleavage/methylation domain-containing protein
MTKNMKRNRTDRIPAAFTLIEMLTVIAIIGILAGLLFPAIKSALQRAEIAQAQNDIKTIETALKMFYIDYGRWPNGNAGTYDFSYGAFGLTGNYVQNHPTVAGHSGYCENHWLMETLRGIPETAGESVSDDLTGPPYCGNGSPNITPPNLVNTRNTPYLSIPTKSLKLSTDSLPPNALYYDFVDPWGNPYQITLDTTYDNVCSNLAYAVGGSSTAITPLGTGAVGCVSNYNVVVWSFGPLGPYNPHNAKDWITSW